LSFLCLFFVASVYGQTTKKILQTFTPDETIKSVKISSDVDSKIIKWSGDFVLIYVKIKAKRISSVNNCKAKYEQDNSILTINLNPNLPEVFAAGQTTPTTVEYEIFVPETLIVK